MRENSPSWRRQLFAANILLGSQRRDFSEFHEQNPSQCEVDRHNQIVSNFCSRGNLLFCPVFWRITSCDALSVRRVLEILSNTPTEQRSQLERLWCKALHRRGLALKGQGKNAAALGSFQKVLKVFAMHASQTFSCCFYWCLCFISRTVGEACQTTTIKPRITESRNWPHTHVFELFAPAASPEPATWRNFRKGNFFCTKSGAKPRSPDTVTE